jgi:hypothetical protein
MENLTDDVRNQVRQNLTTLATSPAEKPRPVLHALLEQHRELILQALDNGHTYRAISVSIRDAGIQASPETIRRYIQRVTGNTKTPRITRRKNLAQTSPKTSREKHVIDTIAGHENLTAQDASTSPEASSEERGNLLAGQA